MKNQYLFIKKHPNQSKEALFSASNLVKYMPVDTETSNLFSTFFNSSAFTGINKIKDKLKI